MSTQPFCSRFFHRPILRRVAIPLALLEALVVSMWLMPSQLAASSIRQVYSLARACNSGKQKACNELTKIAVEDKHATVHAAAVTELTDQSLLAKIAVEDPDARVCRAAALKVTDEALQAKIALGAADASVRGAAVAKLTDQAILAKVAAEDKDAGVRSAAVAKLGDKAWEGVNCLERASVSRFLAAFPESTHTSEAKLALSAAEKFDDIRNKQSAPDYVIPFQKLGPKWAEWHRYGLGLGAVGYLAKPETLPDGRIVVAIGYFPPFTGGKTLGYRTFAMDSDSFPIIPSVDGSIVAFRTGGVTYNWVEGFTVTTSDENSVVFGVLDGVGLVYLTGVAVIREPDGSTVSLPRLKL